MQRLTPAVTDVQSGAWGERRAVRSAEHGRLWGAAVRERREQNETETPRGRPAALAVLP